MTCTGSGVFPSKLEQLRRLRNARLASGITGGTLVFNLAGLWEAAYGDSEALRLALPHAMQAIRQMEFSSVIMSTTTSVQPSQYLNRPWKRYDIQKRMKWAMNQPRVLYHNDLMVRAAREAGFTILDLTTMTESREDDPMEPNDMRHYGATTVCALALAILRASCANAPHRPPRQSTWRGHGNHAHNVSWVSDNSMECDLKSNNTWCRCIGAK